MDRRAQWPASDCVSDGSHCGICTLASEVACEFYNYSCDRANSLLSSHHVSSVDKLQCMYLHSESHVAIFARLHSLSTRVFSSFKSRCKICGSRRHPSAVRFRQAWTLTPYSLRSRGCLLEQRGSFRYHNSHSPPQRRTQGAALYVAGYARSVMRVREATKREM